MIYKKTATGATNYLKLFGHEYSFKDGDSIYLEKTEVSSVEPGTNNHPGYVEANKSVCRILYAGENSWRNDDYRIFYGVDEKKSMGCVGCDMKSDLVPHVHGTATYQKGDIIAVKISGLCFKGNPVTLFIEQMPGYVNPTIWIIPDKAQSKAKTAKKAKKGEK